MLQGLESQQEEALEEAGWDREGAPAQVPTAPGDPSQVAPNLVEGGHSGGPSLPGMPSTLLGECVSSIRGGEASHWGGAQRQSAVVLVVPILQERAAPSFQLTEDPTLPEERCPNHQEEGDPTSREEADPILGVPHRTEVGLHREVAPTVCGGSALVRGPWTKGSAGPVGATTKTHRKGAETAEFRSGRRTGWGEEPGRL